MTSRTDLWSYEKKARQQGYQQIAGIDEAGRGPLAGPVVATACILPQEIDLPGIKDSKKLSPERREAFYEILFSTEGVKIGVGVVDHLRIDEINILNATKEAMIQAISKLDLNPDYLLVDGLHLAHPIPCLKIIKGDNLSISIMAAAIIAKVTRDRVMAELDAAYPEYGFKQHKGYGTAAHLEALRRLGRSPIHRQSFEYQM